MTYVAPTWLLFPYQDLSHGIPTNVHTMYEKKIFFLGYEDLLLHNLENTATSAWRKYLYQEKRRQVKEEVDRVRLELKGILRRRDAEEDYRRQEIERRKNQKHTERARLMKKAKVARLKARMEKVRAGKRK